MRLRVFSVGVLALVLGACTSAPAATPARLVGNPAAGKAKFEQVCIACHGADAEGKPGLGKDLTTSTFAKGLSDADLIAFIAKGRDTSDPLNTTGVAMPPRGGNLNFTDQDLADIVAYIRILEK
jgi:mono/diheme cytochrome c family protein